MTLTEAARLFLKLQAQQGQSPQMPAATRLPAPPPRLPLVVAPKTRTPASRPPFEPSGDARPTMLEVHAGSHAHGDEQWARCCETVHAAGMIRCGFRPLTLAAVDVSKPADVGLAYLDLGPFLSRHLSKMG